MKQPKSAGDQPTLETPGERRTVRRLRAGHLAVAVGAVALVATACVGGGGTSGVATLQHKSTRTLTTAASTGFVPSGANMQTQLLAFSACMRKHGEPGFPDPVNGNLIIDGEVGSPVQPQSSQFQGAMKVCQHLGGSPQVSPVQQRQGEAKVLKAAKCMRAHGFPDYPDPTFDSSGGMSISLPQSMLGEVNSPLFKAAQITCGNLGFPG
ncbi:MAG TPA: hypothetical protein VMS00_04850 [Acidimicrobiales bacterium]|nr:hypothetical protein [Acidimicrobiales bacterium]